MNAVGVPSRPILLTKLIYPAAPRIARLSSNVVLPRSIPLPNLLAGSLCGGLGMLLGGGFGFLLGAVPYGLLLGGVVGVVAGIAIVQWRPWQGESVLRVVGVKLSTRRGKKWSMCPGSGGPALYDEELGTTVCVECLAAVESEEGLADLHLWHRQIFVGMMPVGAPENDAVTMRVGSVAVRRG